MKKLYSPNKGAKRIHPSPPPLASSHLSSLPSTLLTLASLLSIEDQEVLTYLLGSSSSSSSSNKISNNKQVTKNNYNKSKKMKSNNNHPPELGCSCFGCYKSYWARWDSSPNRHVIHTIIDAFEESLVESKETSKSKSNRRKRNIKKIDDGVDLIQEMGLVVEKLDDAHAHDDDGHDDDEDDDDEIEEEEEEGKSSMRRFVRWVFGINN